MAKVYGSATVTIAATRSSAVWNGFLGERKPLGAELPGMVFELPCRRVGRELGKLILIPFTFERTDPLDLRAWTFQERVLSPRVVDFGSLHTQWSCQMIGSYAGYSDGWSSLPMIRAYGPFDLNSQVISTLIAGKYDVEDMLQFWMRITEGFTYRAITFLSDKLPAIAGMADRFGAVMPAKYCAGLWRIGMPVSLMWSAMRPEARPPRDQRCVPSWSWAAISGPVKLDRQHTNGDQSIRFEVQVLDCRVELTDKRSPYGAVKSGEFTIRAYVQRVKWVQQSIYGAADTLVAIDEGIPIHPEALDLGFKMGDSIGINVLPDAVEHEFVDDEMGSIDAFLALCGSVIAPEGSGLHYALFGLVLRSEGGRYSRVGMFQKTLARKDFDNYVHWFRKYGQETFVVV